MGNKESIINLQNVTNLKTSLVLESVLLGFAVLISSQQSTVLARESDQSQNNGARRLLGCKVSSCVNSKCHLYEWKSEVAR